MRLLSKLRKLFEAMAPADAVGKARLEICRILRAQLGHDFSGYRAQTFLRRVERRMQVANVSALQDYIARLRPIMTKFWRYFATY